LLNGSGVCEFPSGNRYVGEFRNGVSHGKGVFIFADGTRTEGTWRDGNFVPPPPPPPPRPRPSTRPIQNR
jgi:hypothetical protein